MRQAMSTIADLKRYVAADLYRIAGGTSVRTFAYHFAVGETFRHIFWLRLAQSASRGSSVLSRILFMCARVVLTRSRRKTGINISWSTEIGPGLLVGHAGGVVVSPYARLGRDVNVSHNVTIGVSNGGRSPGAPIVGNRVYIGPGAVLIGGITVGDDVAIGANATVTKDVPDGATVRNAAGEIYSGPGSVNYVNRTSENVFPGNWKSGMR